MEQFGGRRKEQAEEEMKLINLAWARVKKNQIKQSRYQKYQFVMVQVLRGKKVPVHGDGEIFVNDQKTNLKQWASSSTRYSNLSGQEQSDVSGKSLEQALYIIGFLPR